MSVLSDKWIINSSTKPTHIRHDRGGLPTGLISPPYDEQEQDLISNWRNQNYRDIYGDRGFAKPISPDTDIGGWTPVITPFYAEPVRYVDKLTGDPVSIVPGEEVPLSVRKVISFGTSSYGYDVRLQADPSQIKVFTNVFATEINPKRIEDKNFHSPEIRVDEEGGKYVLIPPHSYLQAPTVEYFNIPRDVLILAVGKSTLARSALLCNVTPMEPEWEGNVTMEIANLCSSPVRCYLEEGIAQFVFFKGDEPCITSYKDKGGKYQGQTGLTYAKV